MCCDMLLADPDASEATVAWTALQFDPGQVDAAGRAIADFTADDDAFAVVNNWRSSHAFPPNTFQSGLRAKAVNVDPTYLVAQRIKRLSSIVHKLDRFKTMRLSQMQDIGGCRAVVDTIDSVYRIVKLYDRAAAKHKLVRRNDYIESPQRSGYRGYHLIYRYYSDRSKTYNDLKVEIQVRSACQHIWTTAVEAVGTFVRQAFKSSLGEEEWLRFFALMGSVIAFRDNTAPVPNTPADRSELLTELRR
jgi:hypothetical protein